MFFLFLQESDSQCKVIKACLGISLWPRRATKPDLSALPYAILSQKSNGNLTAPSTPTKPLTTSYNPTHQTDLFNLCKLHQSLVLEPEVICSTCISKRSLKAVITSSLNPLYRRSIIGITSILNRPLDL